MTSLIGPDANEQVFEPSPEKVRLLTQAQLLIVNGLGLGGWLTRLIQSARYREPEVIATEGIAPLTTTEAGGMPNIAWALVGVDPAHAGAYLQRFGRYKAELDALDRRVRERLGAIPAEKRRVITTHDAFAYSGGLTGSRSWPQKGSTPQASLRPRQSQG